MKNRLLSLRWLALCLLFAVACPIRAADDGQAAPDHAVVEAEPAVEEESDLDRLWSGVKAGASKTGHAIKTGSIKAADATKRGYDKVVDFFSEEEKTDDPQNTPE